MHSKLSNPLSSFLGSLVQLDEALLEVTFVKDNAAGHIHVNSQSIRQRRRRAHGQVHKKKENRGLSRWQSWPSPSNEEEDHMTIQESGDSSSSIGKPSCRLRRPQRSRSDENVKEELNRTRFSSCAGVAEITKDPCRVEKSQRVMALRQPQRQTTPDVNYDVERAMAIRKERAVRKPVRQLTPPVPNAVDKKAAADASTRVRQSLPLRRCGSGPCAGSPTTAFVPRPLQLQRQGSLD
jgi:hypothetical protein